MLQQEMTMLLKLLQPVTLIQILFDKEFTHLDLSLVLGTAAVCFILVSASSEA